MRTIYLDMDDVLADFNSKLLKYGIDKREPTVTNKEIMVPLRAEINTFFIDLPLVFGSQHLLNLYNHSKHKVKILTSTPPNMNDSVTFRTAYSQKLAWLEKCIPNFNSNDLTLVRWGEKHRYCVPGDILVDDSLTNIRDWNRVGGIGINYIPYLLVHDSQRIQSAKNIADLINNICR